MVYQTGALWHLYSVLIFLLADTRQLALLLSSLISTMRRGEGGICLLLKLLEPLEDLSSVTDNIITIGVASEQRPLSSSVLSAKFTASNCIIYS